jgi:hypothetical protein
MYVRSSSPLFIFLLLLLFLPLSHATPAIFLSRF